MWTFVHGPKTVSHVIDEHIAPQKNKLSSASWYIYPIHISQNMDETTQAYPNKYHIILEHMGLSQNPTLLSPCCWQMDGSIPMLCPHEIPNMLYIVPIQSWFSMSIWCSLQNIHRWCKKHSKFHPTHIFRRPKARPARWPAASPASRLGFRPLKPRPVRPVRPFRAGGPMAEVEIPFADGWVQQELGWYFSVAALFWLVGWPTPLKNISHLGWLSHILWKIKNVWNHQPAALLSWIYCLIVMIIIKSCLLFDDLPQWIWSLSLWEL